MGHFSPSLNLIWVSGGQGLRQKKEKILLYWLTKAFECVKVKSLSRVWLFVTPWTVAYQASPSMGFSRQEYWSGLPFPSPGDLSDPGIEPRSPTLEADALTSEPPVDHNKLWKILKEMGIPDHLTCLLKEICMQIKKQQLEPYMEQLTGSKLGKE